MRASDLGVKFVDSLVPAAGGLITHTQTSDRLGVTFAVILVLTAGVPDAEADTEILPTALGAGIAGGLSLIKRTLGGGLLLTLTDAAGVALAADAEDGEAGIISSTKPTAVGFAIAADPEDGEAGMFSSKISTTLSTTGSEDSEDAATAASATAFELGLQQMAFESPLNPAVVSSGLMSVRQTGHREALRSHGCTQEL